MKRYQDKKARRRKVDKIYQNELMNVITNDIDKLQGQADTIIDKLLPMYIEGERWVDNPRYVAKSPLKQYVPKSPLYGKKSPLKMIFRVIRWFVRKIRSLLTNS